ncbi:MAG: methyltransferase domain-containing protein, partial [Acidobacteriota bacterium]
DIGSGSGRDVLQLLDAGIDAYGLEPCEEFIRIGEKNFPELKTRIIKGSIPDDPGPVKDNKFDGILCSAILMHIPDDQLFDSVFTIRSLLKDNGKLVISVPNKRDDINKDKRDNAGRLMIIRDPYEYQLMFERAGFQLIDKSESDDALERPGIKWSTMIFVYNSDKVQRPIDKIESILNRDKKDATYKLALFRALCDIARTDYRQVKWEGNNKVSVPLDIIAEKWIEYYWPIIESKKFIPQKFGEKPESGKKIVFRESLKQLTDVFYNSGKFQGFVSNLKSGLKESDKILYKKTLLKIKTAITTGPVVYAGGSLKSGRVFEYIKESKRVAFNSDIWKELILMGHWINDSLILRWGELTSSFSKGTINPSSIINLLLIKDDKRDVAEAKKIYDKLKNKECVWSGRSIKEEYDVDHAIPFSLWKNNDLWNLFPASSVINNKKRDKLPTSGLIKKRKDLIIFYWEIMRREKNRRFDLEVARFTNINKSDLDNWQNILFSGFKEAVEITAIQRGWERWEG